MPPTLQDQQFGGLSYSAGYRIDIYKAHKCKNIQSQDRIAQMQQVFSLGHLSMECSRISLTNTFPQLGMFNMFGGWAVPLTNSCRREWGVEICFALVCQRGATLHHSPGEDGCYPELSRQFPTTCLVLSCARFHFHVIFMSLFVLAQTH